MTIKESELMDVQQEIGRKLLKGLVPLAPDNFTPIERTPWAGKGISKLVKHAVDQAYADIRIGESWEFSCDPLFPSKIIGSDFTLAELVSRFPAEVLSPGLVSQSVNPTCEILVKLLHADSPLSIQVHPRDDDPALSPEECGKPESWLVLDAESDAGLYIGFSHRISRQELREVLADGKKASNLLQFVPVSVGDYFEIAPGVPHAVGPGVLLLEPQRILFGKSGKTYRFWDWGRKYDVKGQLDMINGKPRDLHVDEALALVDSEKHVGLEFVNSLKRHADILNLPTGCRVSSFPSNDYYQTHILDLQAGSKLYLSIMMGYGALVSIEGSAEWTSRHGVVSAVHQGCPALLPYNAWPFSVASGQGCRFALVTPLGSSCMFQ
jgi:mannose-6-phosphate isomerase